MKTLSLYDLAFLGAVGLGQAGTNPDLALAVTNGVHYQMDASTNDYVWIDDPPTTNATDGQAVEVVTDKQGSAVEGDENTSNDLIWESDLINGLGGLKFRAVSSSSGNRLFLDGNPNLRESTFFALLRFANGSLNSDSIQIVLGGEIVSREGVVWRKLGDGNNHQLQLRRGNEDTIGSSSSGITLGNIHIITSVLSIANDTFEFYIDGNLVNSGTYTGTAPSSSCNYSIGSFPDFNGQFLDADLGEMVIYDRVLNSTEISDMHDYLNNKWGLS